MMHSMRCLPFLQDLALLGRDLGRTVLVDDTPLAFLHQPDNGIPIFNFRWGSFSEAFCVFAACVSLLVSDKFC